METTITDVKNLQNPQYWKKGNLLGRGRFGDVYLYTRITDGHAVAVKEVRFDPHNNDASEEMQMLRNEIDIYEAMSHERIATYLGSQTDDNNFIVCICLEYFPGGSLFSLLQKKGPLNLTTTIDYTRQILEGLVYLHQKCIIHRDINGKNVLIGFQNNIKLVDFGIAKRLETLSSTHGAKTACVGTMNWMAPEVVNEREYGFKVDIWSVGCTVVEMLTARPPWPDCSNMTVMKKISNEETPVYNLPISNDELKDFLSQCFQVNPKIRPSADKLLQTKLIKPTIAAESLNNKEISSTVSQPHSDISSELLLNFNVGYLIHSGVSILSVLNDELLISSHGLSQLFIYSQEGRHRSSVTTYDNDKLFDAIWTPHGNILYTTINNKKVVLMSESGKVISIHTHLTAPQHLSASNDGDIYLADGESGIYHSTNNGVNWSLVFKPTEEWSCLQVIKVTTDRSDDFWTLEKKFESIHLRTYTINRKRSEFGITFTDISDDENIKLSTCSSLSFDDFEVFQQTMNLGSCPTGFQMESNQTSGSSTELQQIADVTARSRDVTDLKRTYLLGAVKKTVLKQSHHNAANETQASEELDLML